jgi:hypothetical protein
LGLTTGGTGCSCSPRYPTPTASLFGGRDATLLLARREKYKRKYGNNGFGLTLGQYCLLNNVELTPELVEGLMGFPEKWTDLEDSETPSCPKSRNGSGE